MKGLRSATVIFSILAFPVFATAIIMLAGGQQSSINIEDAFFSAVLKVRESEVEGAEERRIQDFATRLNVILEMIEEAHEAEKEGRPEESRVLAARAEVLLQEIVRDADEEKAAATEGGTQQRLLAAILVPVASVIMTILSVHTLRYARRRSVERLFQMRILGKGDEKENQSKD